MRSDTKSSYFSIKIIHLFIISLLFQFSLLFLNDQFILSNILYVYTFMFFPGFIMLYHFYPKVNNFMLSITALAPVISICIIYGYYIMISFFSVLPSKALIHGINFVITFSSLAFSVKKNTIRDDIIKITTPINIKTTLFSNRVLLFIYLLLVGIFLSLRYPSTFADDPWFHVIYSINYLNYNPSLYTAYRGLFGFYSDWQ